MKKFFSTVVLLLIAVLVTGCRTYQFNDTPTKSNGQYGADIQTLPSESQISVGADVGGQKPTVVVNIETTTATKSTEAVTKVITSEAATKDIVLPTSKPLETLSSKMDSASFSNDEYVGYILQGFNSVRSSAVVLDDILCGYAQAQANKMAAADMTIPDVYAGYITSVSQYSSLKQNILNIAGSYMIKNDSRLSDDRITKVGIAYAVSGTNLCYVAFVCEAIPEN